MGLQIASLNSGSNGNCYYVGNAHEAVLIDVGISCREVERRMQHLNLSVANIKAIFVSHEHGDHIKGVSTFANRYKLPVYITEATAKYGPILIGHLSKKFIADVPVAIGDLTITPFAKQHDAADAHSFVVSYGGVNVGIFTDIGRACTNVIEYFKICHAIFLEANYDETMLENGRYPFHLKNRISGGFGHLSNRQALDLFLKHKAPYLSHVMLSHLSKENNDPQLAQELFATHAGNTKISVASRYKASEVYNVDVLCKQHRVQQPAVLQLALFA
jgi:phosphoribosyl 1,2-cyclic phosphodiesterase